jgi:sodium/bile acid cotransporter 7
MNQQVSAAEDMEAGVRGTANAVDTGGDSAATGGGYTALSSTDADVVLSTATSAEGPAAAVAVMDSAKDTGKEEGKEEADPKPEPTLVDKFFTNVAWTKKFVIENFLVVGFSAAAIVALSFPLPGMFMSSLEVGSESGGTYRIIELLNNVFVFLVSGLSLKTDDLFALLKFWRLILYGIFTINFLTTLVAFVMIRLPFPTHAFAMGFTIFSTVPTTLGVGVALTLQAKGDQALSLFLTVCSNMLGTVIVPYLLYMYLSQSGVASVSPAKLVIRLIYSVMIPSLVGILSRKYSKHVAAFMVKYKVEMGLFSNSNLICIVWMALSVSRQQIVEQHAGEIVCIIITAVIQHVFYLVINYVFVFMVLRVPLKQSISVTIMASQKSSPVALAVISNMVASGSGVSHSVAGLYTLPCVIGQLTQIFIGSVLVKFFSKQVDAEKKALAEREKELAKQKELEAGTCAGDDVANVKIGHADESAEVEGTDTNIGFELVPATNIDDVELAHVTDKGSIISSQNNEANV